MTRPESVSCADSAQGLSSSISAGVGRRLPVAGLMPASYDRRMTVARLAVSLDPKLARAVRKAAGRESMSSWLADAAQAKLRAEGLARTISDWERAHGEITEEELRAVRRRVAAARRR